MERLFSRTRKIGICLKHRATECFQMLYFQFFNRDYITVYFLDEDEDDGYYKSPSNEDCFTSGSEILSGDEDEEEEFDRIQKIHASEGAR